MLPERWLPTVIHNSAAAVSQFLALSAPKETIRVVMPLSGAYPARDVPPKRLAFPPDFRPKTTSLETFTELCLQLAHAPWLEGVTLRFEDLEADLATLFAMHQALSPLREAGKTVHAHLTSINLSYLYLASAADTISAPESADVFLNAPAFRFTFYAAALEKLGVQFDKRARAEYKNAADNWARADMSDAQREQYDALRVSVQTHINTTLAERRQLSVDDVQTCLTSGLVSAKELQEKGLLDTLRYDDSILKKHRHLQEIQPLLPKTLLPFAKRVAVVRLEGIIATGKTQRSPVPLPIIGTGTAGADTVVSTIRRADADTSTAAIVLYVNSPGGSALASDLIWHAVAACKKPVVAVMGSLAASGGYYVLTHAKHVIAAPVTITGSIGVVIGKFVWQAFNERYGINHEILSDDPHAGLLDANQPFSDADDALLSRSLDTTYQRFKQRVAEGREMTLEQVETVARGRVWTGADALEQGLVDELGDLPTGIAYAKRLADLPADAETYNASAPEQYQLPKAEQTLAVLKQLTRQLSHQGTWLLEPDLLHLPRNH
jgi:protease-4